MIKNVYKESVLVNAALWTKILQLTIVINEEVDKLNVDKPIKVIFESRKLGQHIPKCWLNTIGKIINLQMTKQVN